MASFLYKVVKLVFENQGESVGDLNKIGRTFIFNELIFQIQWNWFRCSTIAEIRDFVEILIDFLMIHRILTALRK